MKALPTLGLLVLLARGSTAQPAPVFDVAVLKRSQIQKGVDFRGRAVIIPNRLSATNVTLQHLIATAYHVQHSQVSSALKWLDSDEFDIEARASAPVDQIRVMLRSLLAERFHLMLRREVKDLRVHALVVDKGGPKIASSKGSTHFHGDMRQFADLLGAQATIPASADPSRPAIASSAPMLVIDKTGLDGVYDIDIELKPELGTDQFTQWQRALKEQLGLKLESQKAMVEVLVVTGAERVPAAN